MNLDEIRQAVKERRLVPAGGAGQRMSINRIGDGPKIGDVLAGPLIVTAVLEGEFSNIAEVEVQRLVPVDWEAGPDPQAQGH